MELDSAQLSDYVISSYTPTLSALLDPLTVPAHSVFKMVSVIESSVTGASYIPHTKQELERIQHHLAGRDLVVLEGLEATRKSVMKAMENCHWIHLACHGVQNSIEPTKSALLIHDGHLTLEEIIRLHLPDAEFAFLSACQTTTGDEKLSEEAVHIAGGMLLAGYRSVVATMWSIQDELAPEVADEFYAHILKDGQRPNNRNAAEALHLSVKKLREKRRLPFTAWIPFVHLGI
jgi:CHAT domain-containing protein